MSGRAYLSTDSLQIESGESDCLKEIFDFAAFRNRKQVRVPEKARKDSPQLLWRSGH